MNKSYILRINLLIYKLNNFTLFLRKPYKKKLNNNKINIETAKKKIAEFFNDMLFCLHNIFMVRLLGFEPRTSWSVAKRSIQLSYRRCIYLK